MDLKIYNTLSRKKEKFRPQEDKIVKIYVCGPTVYDYDHLGHARVGIFYDIVRRYFLELGFKVIFVQNITDVGHLTETETGEDKIEKKAKAEKKRPEQIAHYFEKEHFKDFKSLNILKPDFSPRASEYIDQIIKFIQKLIAKNYAYRVAGSVYFDVTKFSNYGKLSGRKFDQQRAGARVKIKKEKRHPADFALWQKASAGHLMQWDSPWGKGYPGWHIECSTMISEILGKIIDIHGGAIELIFPHHENEIAQSESGNQKPLVKYWMHLGLVTINGEKMSKSKGNFIYIHDALKKYHPDAIRIAMLSTQYRKPLDWTELVINQAEAIRQKLLAAKSENRPGKSITKNQINIAMVDDFNCPKALQIILDNLNNLTIRDFEYLNKVFGLKMEKIKIPLGIKKLIKNRQEARGKKDFELADNLRQEIEKRGYLVEDFPEGSKIRKI